MMRMRLGRSVSRSWIGVLATLVATAASAATRPDTFTYDLRGIVGPYRIGAELVVENNRSLGGGHYFYASKLADIPLTGMVDGETVTLKEPGGGMFRLHLVGNGSNGNEPLTFRTSVGLIGDWVQGDKTLPVKLTLSSGAEGDQPARRYEQVTDDTDAVFESRVQDFVKSVLSGDKAAAAERVSFPLHVNGTPKLVIGTKKDLMARWDTVFTPKLQAAMRDTLPHEMFVHNGQAMIGDGLVWFDAKGAVAINEP